MELAHDRHGDDGGAAVVLLHGLSSSRETYAAVIEHLLDRGGFDIVNADLRGHGDSPRAALHEYRATEYACDVAELIEQVLARPAIVIGHSLGGVVAAQLATAHTEHVRAVFLEDPPLFEGDAERRASSPVASLFPRMIAAVLELQARDAPASAYEPLVQLSPPDERAQRCDALRRWDPMTMQAAIDGIVWEDFDPHATLPVPATVLQADPAAGAVLLDSDVAAFRAANRGAHVSRIDGATHGIHGSPTRAAYLAALDDALAAVLDVH